VSSSIHHPRPETGLPPPQPLDLPGPPEALWPELQRVGSKLPLREYLREIWRRREFAVTVPMSELRANNQDTALGQLWHLLNPLMLVGVYYLVFGVILQVETRRGMDVDDYLPFLIVGVLTFNFTRSSVRTGAKMIVKNRKLVQSINFPRAILPASAMVSETVAHFFAIPVIFVLILLTGVRPSATWLLVVPIVIVQAFLNLGLCMAMARISFHFRDVENVMPFLLRVWFYISGVLFPINPVLIPQPFLRNLLEFNPGFAVVQISRDAFLDGTFDPRMWAIASGWAVFAVIVGFWFFRRAESEYGRV